MWPELTLQGGFKNMISNDGMNDLTKAFQNIIHHAAYVCDGETQTVGIYKVERKDSKIRIFVYLNENQGNGIITKVQLINNDGKVFDEKIDIIKKQEIGVRATPKGLLIVFEYGIQEVAAQ